MKLCNRGWASEKSIESMTSGFRMLGLSRMRRTDLVALIKGRVFNSMRAGVLETLSVDPVPALESAFLQGVGDGCGRMCAQSQGQEAERGFPCVEKPDYFREVTYQGQCWVQLLYPGLVSHTHRGISPTAWTHRYKKASNAYSRLTTARPGAKHLEPTLLLNPHQLIDTKR